MVRRIDTSLPLLPKANFMLRLDTQDVYGEHPIYIYYIVNGKQQKFQQAFMLRNHTGTQGI